MNVIDNQVVLEEVQGSVRYRDIPANTDRCLILYTGPDPNGVVATVTGSVAFGPSGSWENISPGGSGTVWELIGTMAAAPDGFLAPNEFWIDNTIVIPGPTGREVASISTALTLANTLFAPGVAIALRLREGQTHTWPSSVVAPTRDVTLYAEGQVNGEGVDETTSGRLAFGGGGVQLAATATRRRLTIHDLSVTGTLFVSYGWDVICREDTFTGAVVSVDQGGGVGTNATLTFDRCTDDGDAAVDMTKAFRVETTNHAPEFVNRTIMSFIDCAFNPVVTAVEPRACIAAGNSDVTITRGSFLGRINIPFVGLFATPAGLTNYDFIDTELVFDVPLGIGRLFTVAPKPPVVRWFGNCRISVIDAAGLPTNNWNLGNLIASGPLTIENGQPPSNPFMGLVMADENIAGPGSGLRGPITKRVFTRHGLAFTGGRKVYGACTVVHVGIFPTDQIVTWYTPTTTSAPTTTTLPLGTNQVIRVLGRAAARRTDAPGWATFTFDAVIQKVAGIATFVDGPNVVADPAGSAALLFTLTFSGENLQGQATVTGPPLGATVDYVVECVPSYLKGYKNGKPVRS